MGPNEKAPLLARPCTGKACSWNLDMINRQMGCSAGDGSCIESQLLIAAESDFFPADLIDASERINEILNDQADPYGRQLAFVQTPFGLMLSWVNHDMITPPGSVNSKSPEEEIAGHWAFRRKKIERRIISRKWKPEHNNKCLRCL
jgi:hypothetical protein